MSTAADDDEEHRIIEVLSDKYAQVNLVNTSRFNAKLEQLPGCLLGHVVCKRVDGRMPPPHDFKQEIRLLNSITCPHVRFTRCP